MNWIDGAGKQTILDAYKSELKAHESTHASDSDHPHGIKQVRSLMNIGAFLK